MIAMHPKEDINFGPRGARVYQLSQFAQHGIPAQCHMHTKQKHQRGTATQWPQMRDTFRKYIRIFDALVSPLIRVLFHDYVNKA